MRKALYLLVAMILMVSFSLMAGDKVKRSAINTADIVDVALPDQAGPVSYPVVESSSLVLNEVDAFVENIRCILGAGRNVIRVGSEIHVGLLEGTTGSYELYWAGSTDEGANWTTSSHLGSNAPDDDRYPSLAVNPTNGDAFISFHQPFSPGIAYGVHMTDPFGDVWTISGALNGAFASATLSFTNADGAGNVANGFFENNVGQGMVGVHAPPTWNNIALVQDTTAGFVDMGPAVAIEGNYIIAMFTTTDDANVVPTDTAVTNHGGYQLWNAYRESTDGGATWSASMTPYGMNLADFPTVTGDRNGTVGDVAAATGTWWQNFNTPIIWNGNVYSSLHNGAVTLNDGTFPYGYWDGIMTITMGTKAASGGGSWTHSAISSLHADAADNNDVGEIWQSEIGVHTGTGSFAVVALDQAVTVSGEQDMVGFFSADGGATWAETFREDMVTIGFPTGTGLFSAMSPWLNRVGDDIIADVVLLGDNGGIVNTTLYHTQVLVGTVGIKDNPNVPREVKLSQNYPNPFNPTTNISFELQNASDVSLKVYNAIGQEVATLVNGQINSGVHTINFNGENLSSGVYFYTLKAGNFTQTNKMLLVK